MPGKYSSSVGYDGGSYTLFPEANQNNEIIVRVLESNHIGGAFIRDLEIDGRSVPCSNAPISATILDSDIPQGSLRLYVIGNQKIIQYGLDGGFLRGGEWKKIEFPDIHLAGGSFLLGKHELGGSNRRSTAKSRLHFIKEGNDKGWGRREGASSETVHAADLRPGAVD